MAPAFHPKSVDLIGWSFFREFRHELSLYELSGLVQAFIFDAKDGIEDIGCDRLAAGLYLGSSSQTRS